MDTSEPRLGMAPQDVVKPIPQPDESAGVAESVAKPKVEPTSKVGQIREEFIDPRTISKKLDPEGRSETARAILEARASARLTKEDIAKNEQRAQEIAVLTSDSYRQGWERTEKLTQRLETLVVKLKNAAGLGDKQAANLQNEIKAIESERHALYSES